LVKRKVNGETKKLTKGSGKPRKNNINKKYKKINQDHFPDVGKMIVCFDKQVVIKKLK
jgi:hypothetical protein